jgi:hypothetical protein
MKRFILLLSGMCLITNIRSQYSYVNAGSVYSQNFDGLPGTGAYGSFSLSGSGPFNLTASPVNAANMEGWQFYKTGGSAANAIFYTGTGSNNNSGVLSFGQSGSSNRALGTLPSSGGTYAIGFLITNNTGNTLTSFTVGFTVEQWRNGGSNIANTWSFKYKYGASLSNINQSSLTTNTNLNFSSIISSLTSSALDGTISANKNYRSFTITGISWNNGDQLLLRWDDIAHSNSDAMAIDNFSFVAYPSSANMYQWAGGSSGAYNLAGNWLPNRNSSSTNDILVFNSGGAATVDNVLTETVKTLIVSNGSSITFQNSSTANTFVVSDHLNICAGTSFTIGNNCALEINSTGAVNVNGTLTTNNSLKFRSDAVGTASLGISTGTINGNTTVERFIPAQRAYRLLAHPFNNNIPLNTLLNAVDISGNAGNGFTVGAGINPSAFSYSNVTDAWQSFSNTNSTWNKGQGLLLFIRGKTGEGLLGPNSGNDYYNNGGPSNLVISTSGNLNIGDIIYTTGSSNTWNLIGNPYAAPIDITQVNNLITTAGGSNAFIYVWDPHAQQTYKAVTSGAFIAKQLNSKIIIPSGAAFFLKNTTNTAKTLTFSESIKENYSTPLAVFGMKEMLNGMKLSIEKENHTWDEITIQFLDSNLYGSMDALALEKMNNSNFDIYSIHAGGKKLAYDVRNISELFHDKISLGIRSTLHSVFTIKTDQFDLPDYVIAMLKDHFLNRSMIIDRSLHYSFEVTDDTASQGDHRFEILFQQQHLNIVNDSISKESFTVMPNPANDFAIIKCTVNNRKEFFFQLINSEGKIVKTIKKDPPSQVISISIAELPKGIYFVRCWDGENWKVQKLIKE